MNISARIVKAIVTLPILGTVNRDDRGEVVKKAERYRIHLYAAKPGMKYEKQTHTHLLVGVMDGGAYTTEHVKRSEEVLLPNDRELIALRVDGYGVPISWDSLPVDVESAYAIGPFTVANGQVFITPGADGQGVVYNCNLGINVNKSDQDKTAKEIHKLIQQTITDRLRQEKQPGGLLYGK